MGRGHKCLVSRERYDWWRRHGCLKCEQCREAGTKDNGRRVKVDAEAAHGWQVRRG